MNLRLYLCAIAVALSLDVEAAWAQLSGHGGPVRALAISADGKSVLSGSFDTSAIRWSLATDSAEQVLRSHSDAVNAVVFLQDGRMATAGADARIAIWTAGRQQPDEVFEGHRAPISGLAVSPDGSMLASASWDRTVRLWPLGSGAKRVLGTLGGRGLPVWSVAFLPDNATVLTGGADDAIRRWNALTGDPIGSSLSGTPADPLAAFVGDHGAEIFRACVACHTLSEKDNARAGPTLAGLFGRRIASLPGYRFSDALKSMNIVWTPETVAKLFEVGPNAYTPGTKMPEQRIGSPEDRKALTDFLARATAK